MQSSYASIEIGHRESRERSTPFTTNSTSYLPASLVQNILGCQTQALEAISDQAKANKVIQQENSGLRQRIEYLENQLWSLKKKNSLRILDNGGDVISEAMEVDIKKFDNMEIEKEISEHHSYLPVASTSTAIDVNEQSSSSARNVNEQSSSSARNFNEQSFSARNVNEQSSSVRNVNEQSSSSARNENISDGSQTIQELEIKHKKELENLNKEWSEKYSGLQKKYDQQSKDYQDLKDHYKKRSAEWKRAKQWIEDTKRKQKRKLDNANISNIDSRVRFNQPQNNSTAIFTNESNTKSYGTLTDVTNVQNRLSHSHVNDDSIVIIDSSSSNNKKDDGNYSHYGDTLSQSDILSPNLSLNSLVTERLRSDNQNVQSNNELWNNDHNNQKSSDSNANVLSCENTSNVTEKNILDQNNGEFLKKQKDINFNSLDGTNAEHPIDIIDDYDDNLFVSDDDDHSSSKKRPADVVIKQEQDNNNIFLQFENNSHKRWKQLSDGKDRYALDDDLVNTPNKNYGDSPVNDYANNQLAVSERIYNNGEGNSAAALLTPVTPHNIKNRNPPNRSTSSPNLIETNIRYNETVRKQSERRQLQGEDCRDCRRFYEITGPMPIPDVIGLNRCGHNNQEEQSAESLMEARLQYTSKHRTKYSRAPTPPGFWRVGFPTSQELAETNEQLVLYEQSRENQKKKDNEYHKNREHIWDRLNTN